MSIRFDEVVLWYNPNSTGNGKANSEKLKADLEAAGYLMPIVIRETEYAGHIEKVAHEYADTNKTILLISSSGDGGYHELVNGIIQAKANNLTAGLLPSGNANDHYSALVDDYNEMVGRIVAGTTRKIDVLKVTSTAGGKPWTRYAHSYVGIGLSPTVGKQLTKTDLNFFREKWLVLKYLFKYSHVSVLVDGKKRRYSNLIFSNIDQMSKVVKLSKSSSITDGKFEVNSIMYRSKLWTIAFFAKSATLGLVEDGIFKAYTFRTIKPTMIQLDGEVYRLDRDSDVTVECVSKSLNTVL